MMNNWHEEFLKAPQTLSNISNINKVATAFNACIDAVLKIDAHKLLELINQEKLSLAELEDIKQTKLLEPKDVIKGIFKCFKKGIAEEWLTDDIAIYDWMQNNLGYDKLQMGGQGGIVANALAISGVKEVLVHCNSLPKLQAEQFLDLDNLLSFDESGDLRKACKIDRKNDVPLIHWIIEFNKGDKIAIDGQEFVCPKSNRFIATYDPLNLKLVMDKNFVNHLSKQDMGCIILSGFHALTENNDGINLIENSLDIIKQMKRDAIVHLEIASTQDLSVRKEIVSKIAPLCDSIGVNERETIDILQILGLRDLEEQCEHNPNSINLFKAIVTIKKMLNVKRVALHFFGMYITLVDKDFRVSAERTKEGMVLASVVSASKAAVGSLDKEQNLLWAKDLRPSELGLTELKELSDFLNEPNLYNDGICDYEDFWVVAVPTIIVDKPKTLVGMGDTISSISLIASL